MPYSHESCKCKHHHKLHHSDSDSDSDKCCYVKSVNMRQKLNHPGVLSINDNVTKELIPWSPPDPIAAVGKNRVICMTNVLVVIKNKHTMEETYRDSTRDFFNVASLGTPFTPPFDPYLVYDEFSDRFFLVAFVPGFYGLPNDPDSTIWFAVSKNSCPNTKDDFYIYTYRGSNLADYPKIATDRDALYLSVNEFLPPTYVTYYPRVTAFRKSSLLSGDPLEIVFDHIFGSPVDEEVGDNTKFIWPCQPRPSKCHKYSDNVILAQLIQDDTNTGNTVRIHTVKHILSCPKLISTDITVERFNIGVNARIPQPPLVEFSPPEPIIPLEVVYRILSGVIVNGSLWITFAKEVETVNGPLIGSQWCEIDVRKLLCHHHKAKLIQEGTALPGTTDNTWSPAINVDDDGNMAIAFSVAGIQKFPSIEYTGRLKCDPKGTVRTPFHVAREGTLYYQLIQPGTSRNRWGDYSGLLLDPCDHKTFWLFNQYPIQGSESLGGFFNPYDSAWNTLLASFCIQEGEADMQNAPQTQSSYGHSSCPKQIVKKVSKKALITTVINGKEVQIPTNTSIPLSL